MGEEPDSTDEDFEVEEVRCKMEIIERNEELSETEGKF